MSGVPLRIQNIYPSVKDSSLPTQSAPDMAEAKEYGFHFTCTASKTATRSHFSTVKINEGILWYHHYAVRQMGCPVPIQFSQTTNRPSSCSMRALSTLGRSSVNLFATFAPKSFFSTSPPTAQVYFSQLMLACSDQSSISSRSRCTNGSPPSSRSRSNQDSLLLKSRSQ
ncbi:hypothetical protein BDV98DRAFT_643027, partial [Pterulicium gracile]